MDFSRESKFRISKWNRSSTWLLIFWSQRLAGIKLYFLSSKFVKLPRRNLFCLIKNLFEPLPPTVLKYTAMHVKKKGYARGFLCKSLARKAKFFSIFVELKLKQFAKSPIYSSGAMQYAFLLWYASLQGYKLVLQAFLCHQYLFYTNRKQLRIQ